ncbi:MAG: threonine--tRNA ligase [Armatimonadota bacterium]
MSERVKVSEGEDASRSILSWLKQYHKELAKQAVAVQVGDAYLDLNAPVPVGQEMEVILGSDPLGLEILRHSTAHLMAQAVLHLFPDAKPTIGPAIETGFYYDFATTRPFAEEDLQAIEAEMNKLVKQNIPITHEVVERDECIARYDEMGNEFKTEIINEIPEPQVTVYRQGDYFDLCRGPHVPTTGRLGAFKLLSVAGAYWRGDEKRPMLQRIYGTAFPSKEELEAYMQMREEAKRRDHRRLGRELGLFMISPEVGAGLPLWLPKGAIIRNVLETFLKEELSKRDYLPVYTPHIGKLDLYRTSGHYPYYKESQFPPIIFGEEQSGEEKEEGYLLKPMNCPHHIQIYKSEMRSYRDLPLRLAEFGTVYRFEQSGELGGLTRVRGFTQDDAHLFLTPEQLDAEFKSTVDLILFVFRTLGLSDYRVRVSLRDPASDKYVGDPENWEKAQDAIMKAVQDLEMNYTVAEGEAAFYGPKLDFLVRDSIGREWQLGTVQVDYNLPERFGLEYIGEDGAAHRPVMIHRAPFGSIERFFGLLIEHFAGAFPVWMAPVQAVIIPISERHQEYAQEVEAVLRGLRARVKLDARNESMRYKIREAQMQKIPYMLVLGDKEVEERTVGVRSQKQGDLGAMPLTDFAQQLKEESMIPTSD